MPVDPERRSAPSFLLESRWDQDDVILYQLGVGAGDPPTDPAEPPLHLRGQPGGAPQLRHCLGLPRRWPGWAACPVSSSTRLCFFTGSMRRRCTGRYPPQHQLSTEDAGRAVGQGKAALAVVEVVTTDATGKELFTNRASLFLRGEGGFVASRARPPSPPPRRRARCRGDLADPAPTGAALPALRRQEPAPRRPGFRRHGFDRPILHGLCSFGWCARRWWTEPSMAT